MRFPRIAFVGIDGSGKSSCFKEIIEKLAYTDLAAIGDTIFVRRNGVREKPKGSVFTISAFLGKKVKRIDNRLFYKLLKLLDLLIRAKAQSIIENTYKIQLLLTDGSPLINILGWGCLYYRSVLKQELLKECIVYLTGKTIPWKRKYFIFRNLPEVFLINVLGIRLQKPDCIFFLTADPKTAISRIKERGEKRQIHETEEFLFNLQEAYISVCKLLNGHVTMYRIHTDKKTKDMVVQDILKKIYENN